MNLIHQKNSQNFKSLPIADYDSLLNNKVDYLTNLLTPFVQTNTKALSEMAVFASPKQHFRMRAEFGIWHEGDECYYTMMEQDSDGNKTRVKIETFPVANQAINALMPVLLSSLSAHAVLKHKLFQVEFLSTLSNEMLVTLIYHKRLEDDWHVLAQELQTTLGCYIIGRSRKQKRTVSQDFVIEKLTVNNQTYTYQQLEGGFTQPNAHICQHMLTWACEQAQSIQQHNTQVNQSDLLELYCGNANFTLPLSQYFDKVLATEISKTSVASAQWNIQNNTHIQGVENIAIARLSAEEFTQAKTGLRSFRRLTQAGIDLADYQFSTIFVDPPRAGIDDDTLALLSEFEYIIYISCNPDTLADNLTQLCQTHQLVSSALFDQFPYTHHIEAGVMLCKK